MGINSVRHLRRLATGTLSCLTSALLPSYSRLTPVSLPSHTSRFSMSLYSKTQVFTTGQIAKICQVAPRTVSKWFDTGQLQGYRIPGSNDRRVPRDNLVAFLREHRMPLEAVLDLQIPRVLAIGLSSESVRLLQQSFGEGQLELQAVDSAFAAGTLATTWQPRCILVDTSLGNLEAESIAVSMQSLPIERRPSIIAIIPETGKGSDVGVTHFQECFRQPFDIILLAERVRTLSSSRVTV